MDPRAPAERATPRRVLVIRRDNIGDLVCTLPLLHVLRLAWPEAWIGALVTRYNAEVLAGHPDVNAVLTYQKGKHRAPGESLPGLLFERARQLWRLRREGLDLVILPAEGSQPSAQRMARLAGAQRIVRQDDVLAPAGTLHEVERVLRLLPALGLTGVSAPAAHIVPRPERVAVLRARLALGQHRVLGLHISARKPSQRWPAERFAALVRRLHGADPGLRFVLFWAPGAADNKLHPGDDDKAAAILAACTGLPLVPCPTDTLADLIAGLSLVDRLLCSDGGHMHLAAALGKPMVCLFGKSDAARWAPWGVPHRLLQPASLDVSDLTVNDVSQALENLAAGD
jgi:heptosyltransferase-3